jgi:hypothetical protein
MGGEFGPPFEKGSVEVDISDSTTVSDPFRMNGFNLLAIGTPATLTAATTAITFQACDTVDGTYRAVRDSSAAVSLTIADTGSEIVACTGTVAAALAAAPEYIKLVLNTAQAADRTFDLFFSQ